MMARPPIVTPFPTSHFPHLFFTVGVGLPTGCQPEIPANVYLYTPGNPSSLDKLPLFPMSATSTTSGKALSEKRGVSRLVSPGSYDAQATHYPRVLNAQQHPVVSQFLSMTRSQMVHRFCTTHPDVDAASLNAVLRHSPKHFKWAGCDLFVCGPHRRSLVVETNSCPSGQKSLPFPDGDELNGYGRLIRTAFASILPPKGAGGSSSPSPSSSGGGALAVLYDKNAMEAGGYAGALAEITGEEVYLVECYLTDPDPPARWDAGGHLEVRDPSNPSLWHPVRAALRYVTQKPWTRMPVVPATPLLNPLLPCLAGGRNKMLAARAYDNLNARLAREGNPLRLRTPATRGDVTKPSVPALVAAMGGCAVVKVPYGNAGQGVYTITTEGELAAFMEEPHAYDKFIVQQLVGGKAWGGVAEAAVAAAGKAATAAGGGEAGSSSSSGSSGNSGGGSATVERAYHLGTIPNTRGHSFVYDLRMMVTADSTGFKPCSMYARRAAFPLTDLPPSDSSSSGIGSSVGVGGKRYSSPSVSSVSEVAPTAGPPLSTATPAPPPSPSSSSTSAKGLSPSWLQLGTNLSILTGDLTWTTESERLIMMDSRDFQCLGLGVDDLIDAFVQSCLAVTAIDDQAEGLLDEGGGFSLEKFAAVNDDPSLVLEFYKPPTVATLA